ncbi:MAG: hypothetical protein K0R50_1823 [Eubacterium sp.]|nr:hypothetical protein [Eubacterium sp.]
MYKILFVEDEDIIRAGLKKIVADAGFRFEAVFEANCGKTALEIIKKHSPEIVIADIKMPKMDGLELIRHCRNLGLSLSFIIVSGYGEFEYAQKAITFGVTNYLLKPVKKIELINSISRVIFNLDSTEEQKKRIDVLQKESVRQVLKGKYKPGEIPPVLKSVGLEFFDKSLAVLSYYYKCESDNLIQDKVCSMVCSEIQKPLEPVFSYTFPYNYTVILIKIDKAFEFKTDSLINYLKAKILETGRALNINLYGGLSDISGDVSQIHNLVLQSESALDYRMFYYESKFFCCKYIPQVNPAVHIPDVYSDALLNAVAHGKINETILSVDNLFRFLLKIEKLTPHIIISHFEELLHRAEKIIMKNTGNIMQSAAGRDSYHSQKIEDVYRSSDSINNLVTNIKEIFLSAGRNSLHDKPGHGSSVVDNALKYIEENYMLDLSVDQVSDYISMNPNYFSSLFKAKTGCSITNYLQKIRIEKAKQLLADPKNRIFEIAERVGFVNNKYFFKIFKKETGMTPGEYRDDRQELQ